MLWSEDGRVCSVCHSFKTWDNYANKKSKRYINSLLIHQTKQPKCKQCAINETKQWRLKQSPERYKDLYLKRKYNISYSLYCSLLEQQNYKCKLCSCKLDTSFGNKTLKPNSAVVDHCHSTGRVRGILCNECNRGLGYFHDNSEALLKASAYVTDNIAV